ncbi:MAG: SulP family inorganic anion transporter [Crocosphaera sp.]
MSEIFTKKVWFSNVKNDLLSGTLVALALIPEAISFSIIAGVDPKVGLYASFSIAVITAFMGGRPGMISAATGGMALVMTSLVKDHPANGLQYLLATTILTGILQLLWGWIKLPNQMRFVPRSVMIGFVNALAILIFQAQLPQFQGASFLVYATVAAGLAIIYGLPRLTTIIPSPLVAIIIITALSWIGKWDIPTVGDQGALPTSLPIFALPQVPFNFETLQIILPYALALSLVGVLQSCLTANVVDDLTDTSSNKNQEALAHGTANIITGFFGGMAGSAMIGQSVINIRSGGRARLSTLSAGIFLLIFIIVFGKWVAQIPMAALVAVMIMVSISTFNWGSIVNIRRFPKNETAVMITTVFITVLTRNLAIGVLIGVAMSAIFFSRKIANLIHVDSYLKEENNERIYSVNGQVFFVSVDSFLSAFDFREKLDKVTVDLSYAHLWDHSAVDAVDKVVLRYRKRGVEVQIIGLNEASATLLERLATHDQDDALEEIASH